MSPLVVVSRTLFVLWIVTMELHADASPPADKTASDRVRHRQAALQSLKLTWREDCFDGKGSKLDPAALPPVPGVPKLPPLPADGVTYEQTHTFSYDGKRTNHVATLLLAKRIKGKDAKRTIRSTFDGQDQLTLESDPTREYPYGRIYRANSPDMTLKEANVQPILQWYRLPLSEKQMADLDRDDIPTNRKLLNDVPCVVVEDQSRRGNSTAEFYLDPSRDFIPLRYVVKSRAGISRQTDFEYGKDEVIRWVLNGWEMQWFSANEKPKSTIKATVTTSAINPALPASEFTIEFPAGTFVDDLRLK